MATTYRVAAQVASQVEERLLRRNQIVEEFFSREALDVYKRQSQQVPRGSCRWASWAA